MYSYNINNAVEGVRAVRAGLFGPDDPVPGSINSADLHLDVSYDYDQQNRLWKVTDNLAGGTPTEYSYENAGDLSTVAYPNGVKHAYQYTKEHRLENVTITRSDDSLIRRFNYQLAPTGIRKKVTETAWDGTAEFERRNVTYAYDIDNINPEPLVLPRVYRLTEEATSDFGLAEYLHDKTGNRVSLLSSISPLLMPEYSSEMSFDDRDRMDNDTDPATASTLFDANGNMTDHGEVYDYENHLIQRGNIALKYDSEGNRVLKEAGSTHTYYLLDNNNPTGYPQVVVEYPGNPATTAPSKRYTYGLDLISQTSGTITHYYGYDGHGSVRMLLNDATGGNTVETDRYDYDANGNLINQEVRDGLGNYVPGSYLPGAVTLNSYLYQRNRRGKKHFSHRCRPVVGTG